MNKSWKLQNLSSNPKAIVSLKMKSYSKENMQKVTATVPLQCPSLCLGKNVKSEMSLVSMFKSYAFHEMEFCKRPEWCILG